MDTKKLRQKILDLAIHGKLVPQDPNDEPASVLLERIKAEKERLIKEGKIKRSKKSKDSSDTPHYPYLLPSGWKWCMLEDIVSFAGGKTPSMDNKEYWDNGKNLWVTSKDMKHSHISNSLMKITDKALEVMTIYDKGTLLVVTRSGILKHTLPLAILEKPATINQDLKTISPHLQELSEYLYVIIKANENFILKEYHKDGTTVDSIDFDKFKCLPIPLAPLAEQKRIIDETKHLFSLIALIEQNKTDLQTVIKQTKNKILDLAVHGKLVVQDPNDESASELLKRINPKSDTTCDNGHSRKLPQSWSMCKLNQVCLILDNKRKPINSRERENRIRNKQMSELYPYYGATGQVGYIDNYLIDGHYLLIGEDGAPFLDKYATKAYSINGKSWVNNHAHIIEPQIDFDYLLFYLNQLDYSPYVNGSTRLKLTQSDMKNIIVFLPPLEEQKRIAREVKEIFLFLNQIQDTLEA